MHVRVGGTYALLLYCLSKVEVFFWIILSRSNTTERITDASSTKRNLFFSTAHRATKAYPLQARISLRDLPRNEVSISDFERERERECVCVCVCDITDECVRVRSNFLSDSGAYWTKWNRRQGMCSERIHIIHIHVRKCTHLSIGFIYLQRVLCVPDRSHKYCFIVLFF